MTKWEGLLPIGSVVILNNGEKILRDFMTGIIHIFLIMKILRRFITLDIWTIWRSLIWRR